MAGAITQFVAEVLCDGHIRERQDPAIRQNKRTQIDRIALAVFAKFGTGDPIAAAALEIIVGFDRTEGRTELVRARGRFVPKPGGHEIRQTCSAGPAPV